MSTNSLSIFFTHEAQALLASMQPAKPQAQIKLEPVILQLLPVLGADGVFVARGHGLLPFVAFPDEALLQHR